MHSSRLRSVHKNRLEQAVEETPRSTLPQGEQHAQPRRPRAAEPPALPARRAVPATSEPRTAAPGRGAGHFSTADSGTGPGKGLVARRAANVLRGRESPQPWQTASGVKPSLSTIPNPVEINRICYFASLSPFN